MKNRTWDEKDTAAQHKCGYVPWAGNVLVCKAENTLRLAFCI